MKKFSWLLGCLLLSAQAQAVDGIAFEYGSNGYSDMYRLATTWSWQEKWFTEGNWQVGGYWDASIGQWRGDKQYNNSQTITDIGFTPVFRFEQKTKSSLSPYLEGAIGIHLLSKTYINNKRSFSSAFQFGDHIAIGVQFGAQHQYDLALRMQHLSNAGIKKPNNGIDFAQIRFAYHF